MRNCFVFLQFNVGEGLEPKRKIKRIYGITNEEYDLASPRYKDRIACPILFYESVVKNQA